jgi:hypothetical protein
VELDDLAAPARTWGGASRANAGARGKIAHKPSATQCVAARPGGRGPSQRSAAGLL